VFRDTGILACLIEVDDELWWWFGESSSVVVCDGG
jgi:hypothetical protein